MHRSPVIKASVLFKRLGLILALVGLAFPAYADGLTRVEQTIFGMDCAPCAYGVEHGLKRLPDVTDVRVSLNEGVAIVALTPGSTTTIENIRKVIRDNGFTPKAAQVVVTGKLVRADGHTWLEASGLPRYQLTGVTKEMEATLSAHSSDEVKLEGEIPESDRTARELFVKSLTGENPAARDLPDELPHFDEKGEGRFASNLGYGGAAFRGRFSTPNGVGYGVG